MTSGSDDYVDLGETTEYHICQVSPETLNIMTRRKDMEDVDYTIVLKIKVPDKTKEDFGFFNAFLDNAYFAENEIIIREYSAYEGDIIETLNGKYKPEKKEV